MRADVPARKVRSTAEESLIMITAAECRQGETTSGCASVWTQPWGLISVPGQISLKMSDPVIAFPSAPWPIRSVVNSTVFCTYLDAKDQRLAPSCALQPAWEHWVSGRLPVKSMIRVTRQSGPRPKSRSEESIFLLRFQVERVTRTIPSFPSFNVALDYHSNSETPRTVVFVQVNSLFQVGNVWRTFLYSYLSTSGI